ncbi:SAC3/GANP domain protein associated with nuclear localization of protein [Ceratobasidium sp. AG-Ba]|nr:SAC3/GANP domain protein associated with nuclear localization of protein [Ceratobasidium sp. AG-Ba]
MDAGAEALARRAQRFGKAPAHVEEHVELDEEARLAELIQLRAAERKEAEEHGILSSGKTRLEEAKDLVGTCPGMISEYQYYWRKLRYNNIHALEKDEHGQPQWYLTIKDYARSAAGNEQELPSDVRPPDVLLRTTDYLLVHILTTHPFTPVNQAFIRDRARAIVKDFTMQHVRNAPAIEAHERIVRMAALSMHIFRDQRQPDGPFDHDGERKQFVNALSSLTQFYTDSRTPTLPKTFISQTHIWPHEAEFTAYWHLFSLRRPPPLPSSLTPDDDEYPNGILNDPLFSLAQTFVQLWAQSDTLIKEAENMLLSPKERAAREAREATRGVHRFKLLEQAQSAPTQIEAGEDEDENWRPQRFDYPDGFDFPAHAILRRIADPSVPWVLAAVLEASALDDVRARALWEVWQMRRGGDVLVTDLVDLFGCDGPDDVRAIVDTVAEASGRAVRRLRPKGSDEIRAYRLVGSMKFPSHFPRARRNVRLIDSKRPTHVQLADVVNQSWIDTATDYDLTFDDVPPLVLPERVDVEESDAATKPPEQSRGVTPAETGKVFAGFGAVTGGTKANPFGGANGKSNPFGGGNSFGGNTSATTTSNPFGGSGAAGTSHPFGAVAGSKSNPFGGTTTTTTSSPFAAPSPFGTSTASVSTPFGTSSSSASNPFGANPSTNGTSSFGASAGAFGAGSGAFSAASAGNGAFGAGSGACGAKPGAFGAGSGAFGAGSAAFGPKPAVAEPAPSQSPPTKPGSPTLTRLSASAPAFVPKFAIPGAKAPQPSPPIPTFTAHTAPETAEVPAGTSPEEAAAAAAAKTAREAKLKEKIEAAKKEEARLRAEEEKKAEERRKQEELKKQELEAQQRAAEAEKERFEAEQQRLEALHRQEQAERDREIQLKQQHREQLHSATAQLLLGDILEILVVPEVQYAVDCEKRNRWLVRNAFGWWKTRAMKRAKRRQVLENMGLGRVGVAGAAGEIGELFDEEDEEGDAEVVAYERKRTISLREHRTDADLAAAMAKAAAERERLWAPGIFYDIVKQVVLNMAHDQGKTLDDVPGWDIWLCTSGANKSSAEWLRKKLDARPTQLVDGTVSIAAVTPNLTKKDSAPGLVVFECSPYLGAAMNEAEWSKAWSSEANRIARLFSAMSNHSSYTPSLLFVVWSTDHVAQHAEAISRKIKKAASHLADVSIHGEPAVAVLLDDTVEKVFEEALASLELDIEGRPLVKQSSVTESLSKQLSTWHRTLSQVLGRIPSFDDEDNAPYLAQAMAVLLKAFNAMVSGISQLLAINVEDTIYLPEFVYNHVHDTKSLYNLADSYIASLSFAEAVDLNVFRSSVRQYRHSGKPFPARFFCQRLVQLVDVALTPLVSGNRPRSEVYAAEQAFEAALGEATNALEARTKKRTQDESPVRDNKKARLVSSDSPSKIHENGESEGSGAAKLRALLEKTRNRWAAANGES